MDRGAWWAAVYRVTQSRTRLKRLSIHARIGEGNGNPLQYSCLENPMDRRAWWAAVYGVTQNWARLKRLSSSSSNQIFILKGFPGGAIGKEPACQRRRWKRCRFSLRVGRIPLEEGMATHSSTLAWRIPWTEEPGGLQSMGLQRVGHD